LMARHEPFPSGPGFWFASRNKAERASFSGAFSTAGAICRQLFILPHADTSRPFRRAGDSANSSKALRQFAHA